MADGRGVVRRNFIVLLHLPRRQGGGAGGMPPMGGMGGGPGGMNPEAMGAMMQNPMVQQAMQQMAVLS